MDKDIQTFEGNPIQLNFFHQQIHLEEDFALVAARYIIYWNMRRKKFIYSMLVLSIQLFFVLDVCGADLSVSICLYQWEWVLF